MACVAGVGRGIVNDLRGFGDLFLRRHGSEAAPQTAEIRESAARAQLPC